MTQTTNYNLNLFDSTDKMYPTTMDGLNQNTSSIDTIIKDINDSIGNVETILQTLNSGSGVQ